MYTITVTSIYENMNYQIGLFKIGTFRKLMIRHCWQSPLFALIPSQKTVLTKKAKVKFDSGG
jgi:hypothetical protein